MSRTFGLSLNHLTWIYLRTLTTLLSCLNLMLLSILIPMKWSLSSSILSLMKNLTPPTLIGHLIFISWIKSLLVAFESQRRDYSLWQRDIGACLILVQLLCHNYRPFRDVQRLDKMPGKVKSFYEGKVPRNFFVKANSPLLSLDIENLTRHINFHMMYYDRKSPFIIIRRPETLLPTTKPQLRHFANEFPSALAAHPLDDFILQLIVIARISTPRFAFIYFYQVLEYAGYYFIDEKTKKEIRQFLRNPAMITCPEDKVTELLSVLSDLQQNDETKIRKVWVRMTLVDTKVEVQY